MLSSLLARSWSLSKFLLVYKLFNDMSDHEVKGQ